MTLQAKSTGKKREIAPAGTHMARLVGLIDLGHQPGFEYKGNHIESSFKIEFVYELVNALMKDGRPHWTSEEVKVNDYEGKGITSTMMARVRTMDVDNESINGKNLIELLNKPCMVTLVETDSGYTKIKGQAAVSGIPLGMEVPELVNDSFAFDMAAPDLELFETFPEFRKDKIKNALDFEDTVLARVLAEEGEY